MIIANRFLRKTGDLELRRVIKNYTAIDKEKAPAKFFKPEPKFLSKNFSEVSGKEPKSLINTGLSVSCGQQIWSNMWSKHLLS